MWIAWIEDSGLCGIITWYPTEPEEDADGYHHIANSLLEAQRWLVKELAERLRLYGTDVASGSQEWIP
jgi:hypothetical protein